MQNRAWKTIFLGEKPLQKGRGQGWLRIGMRIIPCQIGRAGIGQKSREGDAITPRGVMRPLHGFYRPDQTGPRRALLSMRALKPQDGWCDQIGHSAYNREVKLPFAASHERLWRKDRVYDVVIVLDWNLSPRIQGRGSAIFLHLSNEAKGPTAGCIALSKAKMSIILAGLSKKTRIMTRSTPRAENR
jgi:L,D-peptidoglycan transpeptidase YkuD (ErfK/YbiS/YcfS/YnhG family)